LMCLTDELFSCDTGVNAYITPAPTGGSEAAQGFAAHFDDIDAYLLQLEGEKKWRLYLPKDEKDLLCLEASPDFKEDDINDRLVWEGTLKKGDLLYMPRGVIH